MANQSRIFPIGRLLRVEFNIDGVKRITGFDAIEIMDDIKTYPTLLRID